MKTYCTVNRCEKELLEAKNASFQSEKLLQFR